MARLRLPPFAVLFVFFSHLLFTSDGLTVDTASNIRLYANLRPWNLRDRQFGGDRFARGLFEYRLQNLNNGSYILGFRVDIKNVKSGGKYPGLGIFKGSPRDSIASSTPVEVSPSVPFFNATREGRFNQRLRRYSYLYTIPSVTITKANFDQLATVVLKHPSQFFLAVRDARNRTMLRGQCQSELS